MPSPKPRLLNPFLINLSMGTGIMHMLFWPIVNNDHAIVYAICGAVMFGAGLVSQTIRCCHEG